MTIGMTRAALFCAAAFAAACAGPAPQPEAGATFLFGFDRESFGAEGVEMASSVARAQAREGFGAVSVIGHADAAGDADANDALALRRAEMVRRELIARGTPPQTLTVATLGERDPAVPTPDGVREQANRRAVASLATPGAFPPPDFDRPLSFPLP
ncbi:OmpA family protein [Rubrimonas cliftonensis]|nr:OmpA family protein [Rubrimonas cliftonensis]